MGSELFSKDAEIQWCSGIADLSALDVALARDVCDRSGMRPGHMVTEQTRAIYEAQYARLREGRPCGILDILDVQLSVPVSPNERIGIAGTHSGPMESFGLLSIAEVIRKLAARRELVAMAQRTAEMARSFEHEPDVVLAAVASELSNIVSGSPQSAQSLDTQMAVVAEELDRAGRSDSASVISTGIEIWDRTLGGIHPTLTIIGAKPGRGKSGLEATILFKLAERAMKSAIFSLEDKATWLIYRKLAQLSGIPQMVLRTRVLTGEQQERLGASWAEVQRLSGFILFDERKRLSPEQVVASARHMILNKGARSVWVDHLSELKLPAKRGGDRHDLDVTEGLMELRALADSHGTPVVALTHVKRDARPPYTMEDFKNSSGVEMAARQALILEQDTEDLSKVYVTVVKNTFGPRDVVMPFKLEKNSAMVVESETEQRSML